MTVKKERTREQERLPPIPQAEHSTEQRAALSRLEASRGKIGGPFVALLRSPVLLDRLQHVGAYLRFESAMPARLSELVILLVARFWRQEFEWAVHAPIALAAGLPEPVVEAVRVGARPVEMTAAEAAVIDFCTELFYHRTVGDAAYARALDLFGEQGVVDMTAIAGYYTTLAMVMNVARTPPPDGAAATLPSLP